MTDDPCRVCGDDPPHLIEPCGDYIDFVCWRCRSLLERLPGKELELKTMTHSQRLAALARLRSAARRASSATDAMAATIWRTKMRRAWRAFPECCRDADVPEPEEVLAICERMEREQAADDAFAAALKATSL